MSDDSLAMSTQAFSCDISNVTGITDLLVTLFTVEDGNIVSKTYDRIKPGYTMAVTNNNSAVSSGSYIPFIIQLVSNDGMLGSTRYRLLPNAQPFPVGMVTPDGLGAMWSPKPLEQVTVTGFNVYFSPPSSTLLPTSVPAGGAFTSLGYVTPAVISTSTYTQNTFYTYTNTAYTADDVPNDYLAIASYNSAVENAGQSPEDRITVAPPCPPPTPCPVCNPASSSFIGYWLVLVLLVLVFIALVILILRNMFTGR